MQIEVAQRNQLHETLVVVDNVVFVPANYHRDGGKPPYDLDKGSSSHSPRHGKSPGHRGGKDSPLLWSHWKKDGYSPERHRKSHRNCPFTRKIVEYHIPRAFEKLPNLKTYDDTLDSDEHMEHIDTVLDYHETRGAMKCKLFILTLKRAAMT